MWLFLMVSTAHAAKPVAPNALPLDQRARIALVKAAAYLQSISTNGGYVGSYSLDLQQRYGEGLYEKTRTEEIWVQPPGTPSVGKALLRAHRVTDDAQHLTTARAAGPVAGLFFVGYVGVVDGRFYGCVAVWFVGIYEFSDEGSDEGMNDGMNKRTNNLKD